MTTLASRTSIAATVLLLLGFAAPVLLGFAAPANAVDSGDAVKGPPGPGTPRFVVPKSSIEQPGDVGHRAHTNYGIVVPQPITGPGNTIPPRAPR